MTFTRLQIGEPRLKGTPRGLPPCVDSKSSGNALGVAGGMESLTVGQLTQVSGALPTPLPSSLPNWVWDPTDFIGIGTGGGQQFFAIDTANPRTGSQHIRGRYPATSEGGFPRLYPLTRIACADSNKAYTCRIEEGDLIDFSFWHDSVSSASAPPAGQESWTLIFQYYNEAGTNFASVVDNHHDEGTTGGYIQDGLSTTAPANSYWLLITFQMINYTTFDIDDAELTIT